MLVLARKGNESVMIQVPSKYDSKYAAVEYALSHFNNEFDSYQCHNHVRKPESIVHYLTKEVFLKMSEIYFKYTVTRHDGVHESIIRVSSQDMSFMRKEYFNNVLLDNGSQIDNLPINKLLGYVHYYQRDGYKLSKGTLSAKPIVAKF